MTANLIHYGRIRILNKSKNLDTEVGGLMIDRKLQSYEEFASTINLSSINFKN